MSAPQDNKAPQKYWTSAISDIVTTDVFIRGYSLGELIGRIPFSAATFLLIRGRMPNQGEARMVDAMLCSILDYALQKPGTAAARYAVSGNPQMVPGIAVAVLSVGEYTLAPEDAGRFIQESCAAMKKSGKSMDDFAKTFVDEFRAAGKRVPGFGHPVFRGTDPRAQKLKSIAQNEGTWGEVADWYEAVHRAFTKAIGKPDIVINEVGMMAAIMSQMGFTPPEMTGVALISSLPGVIAHVSEEMQTGKRIRIISDEIADFPRERRDLDKDLKAAGWA